MCGCTLPRLQVVTYADTLLFPGDEDSAEPSSSAPAANGSGKEHTPHDYDVVRCCVHWGVLLRA